MDSNGRLFGKDGPKDQSRLLGVYEALKKNGFKRFDENLSLEDLEWIQHIHDKHLDFFKEERRMHFGAFALAGIAFVILFPALLEAEQYFFHLVAVEALLLILLVPYVFVYRRFEEGVRRMMRESVIIENHRQLKKEKE